MIPAGHVVFLAHDGDYARFENRGGDDKLDFMLIEAEPTGENVAVQVSQTSSGRG